MTAERKVIFALRVFAQPAMSTSVQVHQIKEALSLAIQELGGSNGRKLRDQLLGPFDQASLVRPVLGEYEFSPTAPPA